MLMSFVMPIVAWFSRQREDIDSCRYLARSIWRPEGKISTILCGLPGTVGNVYYEIFNRDFVVMYSSCHRENEGKLCNRAIDILAFLFVCTVLICLLIYRFWYLGV